MTKHGMFGAPNLRQSKKITPLVVMVETFRMFGGLRLVEKWPQLYVKVL